VGGRWAGLEEAMPRGGRRHRTEEEDVTRRKTPVVRDRSCVRLTHLLNIEQVLLEYVTFCGVELNKYLVLTQCPGTPRDGMVPKRKWERSEVKE
jgi:hypothetical protein